MRAFGETMNLNVHNLHYKPACMALSSINFRSDVLYKVIAFSPNEVQILQEFLSTLKCSHHSIKSTRLKSMRSLLRMSNVSHSAMSDAEPTLTHHHGQLPSSQELA